MPHGTHSTSKQLGWWIFLHFFYFFCLILQMFARRNKDFCLCSIDWCLLANMIPFGWASQPGDSRLRWGSGWERFGENRWASNPWDSSFHTKKRKWGSEEDFLNNWDVYSFLPRALALPDVTYGSWPNLWGCPSSKMLRPLDWGSLCEKACSNSPRICTIKSPVGFYC